MPLTHLIKERSPLLSNGLLLMLAALTGGLLWSMLTPPHGEISPIADDYDAFAIDVVSTQFSDKGVKRYELSAPRLNHYKSNNQTHVDNPVLYLYSPNQENWLVTAEYATAIHGKQVIEFVKNVDISGAGTSAHKNTQLLTEKINYYPDKNSANTPLPVTIVQPGSTIHAIGMDVAFNAGTITLLSKIRGSYNPNVYS
ncbi:MAG: LPS export ABC transporter periplasmic protein LptC [Pseudomonadota bacterium]